MNNYKIALVIGSLRKESFNRKLANALVKLAPTEFSFNELQIGNLPLYNQDESTTARFLVCSRTRWTTRHGLTARMPDARDIGKAILAAARNGDPTAMKIFADRAYPPSKGRTFKIDLPPEPAAAFTALKTAVSNGEISAEETCAVGELIEKKVRAIDMQEMMKRLEALEESQSPREDES